MVQGPISQAGFERMMRIRRGIVAASGGYSGVAVIPEEKCRSFDSFILE
jgi:hypothetical protein